MLTCVRLAALGVAAAVLGAGSVASGAVFIYQGQHATTSVNPNDTQFYSVYDISNGAPAFSYGQSNPVEIGWSGNASSSGAATSGLSDDAMARFGASASASAEAHGKHGHLKAAASAGADVRPGRQVVQYAGQPMTINSPLTSGSAGSIEVGYDDWITVSNPSLGNQQWVTLKGTLHLHAGIEMDNPSMASALAETTLQFFQTYAKLEGSNYFNTSTITLTRHFSQGTWVKDDQHDVEFTIEVLNGVSFGIMQTLKVAATAGANYENDYSISEVNAMNTATLVFTPVGEGTQISTVSGVTYAVPEPGMLGVVGMGLAGVMGRRRK